MKPNLKSAPFCALAAIICCLLLSGCVDVAAPTWMTGEPDETVLNAPRAVGRPENKGNRDYPLLSSVPGMPSDFSKKTDRDKEISDLMQDKAAASVAREEPAPVVPSAQQKQ